MCDFFSFTSDGRGNIAYFDWELRKRYISGELNYNPDSHTSINSYFGYKGAAEDLRNKYEYNPLTGVFTIDMINTTDDSKEVEKIVRQLDFKKIVEPLVIKPIIHPFKLPKVDKVTDEHIEKLKQGGSVGGSVRCSVWDSIKDSVRCSVKDSVRCSVGDSVRDSVRDSIWDSIWAYVSSFFLVEKWEYIEHEPFKNPFQSLIDLWEMGLVPSFDGKLWRLHSGENAEVVWAGEILTT